jgi:CubicO group peptidase (beta-lactamase class C family)
MHPRCWLPSLLLLLVPTALAAQARSTPRFEEARTFIRRTMEEHDLPAVAVAVAKNGRIVWEEGFGWADLERRVPTTPHTLFSLASISKPITATGIMRLVEQGRIDLARPANQYLGEGQIHSRRWSSAGATVSRVLSHTAGLPLHYEFFYEGGGYRARSTDEGIARYGILVAPPGEVYKYSNVGYGVLDRIVERVSGRSYAEFMQAEVFRPLGMAHAVVSTGAGLGETAALRYDADNRPIPPYDFDHRGASAVYSSAHELARFGMFHLGNGVKGQPAILGTATRRAMQRVATPGPGEQYALGWLVDDDHGFRRLYHDGDMPGVQTTLNLYPEENLVIVVLTNKYTGMVAPIAREIASAMLPRFRAAMRQREAEPAADTRSRAQPTTSTPELRGEWSGTIETYQGTVPLTLVFQPDADVHVQMGEEMRTLLNDVSFRSGQLLGRFAGSIPTEDARRHPHSILLNLRLLDGRLVGAATAQSSFFALSSYVDLEKKAGAR